MLYHLPIEPYETRYTADWISQFEHEFDVAGVPFKTILGDPVTSVITQGSVLDACGTNIYKLSQLGKVILAISKGEIKDNDVIFFSDLWFPGIESLFYVRNITGIKFKIVGILHAGTYDSADFTFRTGMRSWGKHLEAGWFSEVDAIFVATHFHAGLIADGCEDLQVRDKLLEKIFVTGIPFYPKVLRRQYTPHEFRQPLVVFPHRNDEEKHPELFDKFAQEFSSLGYDFIKTIESTKSRDEYFQLLAQSKIMLSFADQETFGYSTLEAMALGNIVIVPNKLSYVETVPQAYRYDTLEEARELFNKADAGLLKADYPHLAQWEYAVPNMLELMKDLGYNIGGADV